MEHLVHESAYRGEPVIQQRSKVSVLVLGSGALGSWLLDLLARQGYTRLTVLDFDRVERKNFGTQNFGKADIGRMKATIAANNLVVRLGVQCKAIAEKLTASNARKILNDGFGLVIDAFDNHESREIVKETCVKLGVPCLHCGMSGDGFAEIEWNENYISRPAAPVLDASGEPCEYPLASNLVSFTVALAAEAVNSFVDNGIKRSVHFTLRDLHCHSWVRTGGKAR